jgi:hypothetical protein
MKDAKNDAQTQLGNLKLLSIPAWLASRLKTASAPKIETAGREHCQRSR